jgi:cellulose synthase/poly-beta-1,6-N-acetylglucosamine synthase-like glycosyltransferase
LPVYNELHIVERLLATAAGLDYPRDRLEIQLLDDSTDATRQVAAGAIVRLRSQGVDAVHVTRSERTGFKAGALAAGLATAKGELIAVFDADFLLPPDFLRRVVPHFADHTLGCVQTRWGYLNRNYSLFTRCQAVGIDGHFIVEKTARSRAGMSVSFNGSGGVWRRACIEDAGGWHWDTLTEDLDLSYRAQLQGWRIGYLPDVVVPAELPAQMSAFKRQQARWAQGTTQTALKMLVPLLRSNQPWRVKLQGSIHLTSYLVLPMMLLTLLLALPMNFFHSWVASITPWLMIATAGPPLLYATAQITGNQRWRDWLGVLPVLLLLGMGVTLSNSLAVIKALLGVRQGFQRTPKFALQRPGDAWMNSVYALSRDSVVWGELGLVILALAALAVPGIHRGLVPWLLLYAGGFGYVAGVTLYQAYRYRRWLATQTRATAGRAAHTPRSGRDCIRADWPDRGR